MWRVFLVAAACALAVPCAFSQDAKKQSDKKQDTKKTEAKQPPPPGKLTVAWHGQSFFDVTSTKGTVFVFDPHAISEYGRIEGIKPDVIMISHNHNDHTQVGIFENAAEKGDKAPKIIRGLKPGDDGRETWNIVDEKINDLHIMTVAAYHDEFQGMKHGKTVLFIVDVDGWRIVHLGDLGHKLSKAQLKALGQVDVLMVPCGGIYGLNGNEARDVVNQIKPKEFILPMHIGNRRYDELLPVDEFIDDNPIKCAVIRNDVLVYSKSPATNVSWLREMERTPYDNTLVLERDPARKGPVIVNLHYWPQADRKKKK